VSEPELIVERSERLTRRGLARRALLALGALGALAATPATARASGQREAGTYLLQLHLRDRSGRTALYGKGKASKRRVLAAPVLRVLGV
jgi:hypothetical protein